MLEAVAEYALVQVGVVPVGPLLALLWLLVVLVVTVGQPSQA